MLSSCLSWWIVASESSTSMRLGSTKLTIVEWNGEWGTQRIQSLYVLSHLVSVWSLLSTPMEERTLHSHKWTLTLMSFYFSCSGYSTSSLQKIARGKKILRSWSMVLPIIAVIRWKIFFVSRRWRLCYQLLTHMKLRPSSYSFLFWRGRISIPID